MTNQWFPAASEEQLRVEFSEELKKCFDTISSNVSFLQKRWFKIVSGRGQLFLFLKLEVSMEFNHYSVSSVKYDASF